MKSNLFQTVLLIFFGGVFLVAILVFSGLLGGNASTSSNEPTGSVLVWGVLPDDAMQAYIASINGEGFGYTVTYEMHTPENFNQDLITALANNAQPDIVIYSSEIFSQLKERLYIIPFQAYSERLFRDTNIDGAQLFLSKEGVIGFPLLADPLVVYYNKDLLAREHFVYPPTTWEDVTAALPLFVKRAPDGSIRETALPLGETDNITHMRDILSALFLQTGNQIVSFDSQTNRPLVTLNQGVFSEGTNTVPTVQALSFYTNFSNTGSGVYSWNRSLPSSLDMFLAGRSAFYIGRAGELFTIQSRNPNLNFDVMGLFQPEAAERTITFASFIAADMLKTAHNQTAAYAFLTTLASQTGVDALSKRLSLPPAQRSLLLVQQENPYTTVFFKAALSAFAWRDPNAVATNSIFSSMVRNVTSGRMDAEDAIDTAANDLQNYAR